MQYLPVAEHRTSTGLNSRKLLMWAFLGSDVLFFGTLIATHLVYRGQSVSGPTENILDIPITSISTFVLLMSSLAMVLALSGLQRGKMGEARFWLAATALLGSVFIGFQMYEFAEFANEGLTPRTNLFGSTFLIMTGFHGTHVAIGILWLWSLFFATFNGKIHQGNSLEVEIAGLYWHFVDIVWIVIFGVVYLVGAYGAEEHVEEAGHAAAAIFGIG
ncbi:MAG: cytochrome c oxidase subunit 3 [Chloroflexi bacterium]|nr:cytochrome c oxidase subunit 3 [Chloroflexota bacterium]MDA1173209.1 cytochrome c oxidase subunit 3 [Chloroflexota bacterium]